MPTNKDSTFGKVQSIFAAHYRNEMTDAETERQLTRQLNKSELADFVMDAFKRGWICRSNMGVNEDGNLI